MPRFLTYLLFSFLGISGALGQSLKISMEYAGRRGYVEVGQPCYLRIEAQDMPDYIRQPKDVPGCKSVYMAPQSEQTYESIINGKRQVSVSGIYMVTLKAQTPGSYKYALSVGGIRSNTVTIEVKEAGAGPSRPGSAPSSSSANAQTNAQGQGPSFIGTGDNNLFIRANISKTTCYDQEALVYTLKLYSSYPQIKFVGATSAPKFDGFVIETSNDVDKALKLETYNGRSYETAVVARYIIFPQGPGKKTVKGNTYTISVDKRMYYTDFDNSGFSIGQTVQLNITPNDLVIDVKPLPQPQPEGFSGGVGTFSFSAELPSNKLKTYQAAEVTYKVVGYGNLRYISAPVLQSVYPAAIEVFSPASDVSTVVGSTDVSGSVNFNYSLMPIEAGNFELPPIKFVYFDPQSATYKTLTSRGFSVSVALGESSAQSHKRETLKFNDSLMTVGKLALHPSYIVAKAWYWILFLLPLILLLVSVPLLRKYRDFMADTEGLAARRAQKLSEKWLKKARILANKGDREAFYDALLEALWGYLGNKFKIKSSLLTRGNVANILEEKGVGRKIIDSVIEIIDKAEFVKYTSLDSGENMKQLVADAGNLIKEVESSIKKSNVQRNVLEEGVDNLDSLSAKEVKSIRKEINRNSKQEQDEENS